MPDPKQSLNFAHFQEALADAANIVLRRGEEEGRNACRDFWDTFPHGLSDMTFMVRDKADRILGAETRGRDDIIRDNCKDIINYAAFILVYLNKRDAERNDGDDCPACGGSGVKTLGGHLLNCIKCGQEWEKV